MNILIIVVVVVLMLSPVYWLMPSPRQKRQLEVRQRAMSMGLQVKICDLPQTELARVRKEAVEQGVVYRLPWQNRSNQQASFQQLLLRQEIDATPAPALTQHRLLKEALVQMPEHVEAIEYSSSGLAIYWQERGGVEAVDKLYQQIQLLQEKLTNGL